MSDNFMKIMYEWQSCDFKTIVIFFTFCDNLEGLSILCTNIVIRL